MINKILRILLCVCIAAQCVLFTACKATPQKYSTHSFDYFDTATTITGYADSQQAFDRVAADALKLLGEYHRLYTIYERFEGLENLCAINELVDGKHRTVTVDTRIIDLLTYAKEMYAKTGGKVNIAMGSVLSIWHEYRTLGMDDPATAQLPPLAQLQAAAQHTNINDLVINAEKNTVTLTDPKMLLDVGAVAKGYAVEMVAKALEAQGVTGYVLNVGGNVRTIGTKADGEKWTVGIENPNEDATAYLAYMHLSGESLVTSGSYQRYYLVDGKRYHHIIDPDTLFPREGILSVSVVCNSSADGDALSTALFCMDLEEGKALVKSLVGVEAMWMLSDGTQYYSDGFLNFTKE